MQIRTAKISDAPGIARVHVETWRTAYRGLIPDTVLASLDVARRTDFWRELLAMDAHYVFIAEDDGNVAGFCDLIPTRDRDSDAKTVAEIASIYVLPQYWRQGTGQALCDRALAEARIRGYRTVTLWVLASNDAAKKFYLAMGFRADGATKTDRTSNGSELQEERFCIII